MSNNPYGMNGGNAPGGLEAAKSKIAVPAIALIVDGVLTVIYALYVGLSGILVMAGMNPIAAAQQAQLDEQMAASGQSPEQVEFFLKVSTFMAGPGGIVFALITLLCGALIFWGAIKMKNLQSRGLAFTAAVLAIIPCTPACCIIGLPFGIWGIVTMNDPNVRAHFR